MLLIHRSLSQQTAPFYDSDLSRAKYASQTELQAAIAELRQAFPAAHSVDVDAGSLKTYGSSENSYLPAFPHAVIVKPMSTEDVVRIVNISRRYKVPIVPISGATSLEGHYAGVRTVSFVHCHTLHRSYDSKSLEVSIRPGAYALTCLGWIGFSKSMVQLHSHPHFIRVFHKFVCCRS